MSTIAELDAEYAHLMDRYFQLEENGTPEERRKVMKEIDRFSFRYADLAALQNAGLGSGSASGASAGPVDAPLTPMKRRASQQAEVSPFLPGESGRNIKYRNDGYFYDYDGDGDIGGRRLAMEWATPPATWSPERHQRTNQQISNDEEYAKRLYQEEEAERAIQDDLQSQRERERREREDEEYARFLQAQEQEAAVGQQQYQHEQVPQGALNLGGDDAQLFPQQIEDVGPAQQNRDQFTDDHEQQRDLVVLPGGSEDKTLAPQFGQVEVDNLILNYENSSNGGIDYFHDMPELLNLTDRALDDLFPENYGEPNSDDAGLLSPFEFSSPLLGQGNPDYGNYENNWASPPSQQFRDYSQLIEARNQIAHSLVPQPQSTLNGGWPVPGGEIPNILLIPRYEDQTTKEDIKALLDNIQDEHREVREETPAALEFPLMEHQKIGLAWMKAMEEGTNKGGILADDMGLGKTMQTLALMVLRPSTDPSCKTNLIVAPLSLLKQWEREISKKLKPQHRLSVYIHHHGNTKRYKTFEELAQFDVVITTFGSIATEFKERNKWLKMKEDNPGQFLTEPTKLIMTGSGSRWYRIIIDEAQCIKNRDTQSSKGCAFLSAKYRFCLSGTPMQNSCDELYPLIRFLRIKPYNDWNNYRNTFSVPLKKPQQEGRSIVKFRALLKAILLRRLKTSLIDGQPILILPPKTVEIIHPVFSEDEQNFYSALEAKTAIQFNKYLRANAIGRNYSNILLLLLRLRQACCHPHLIKDIEEPGTGDAATDGVDLALELPAQTVERIQDSGIEECPVCMDMSNNPSIVIPCGHAFCKDCIVRIHALASSRAIHYGNEGESAVCPTCRGPLAVGKVIAWTTFQKVFGPQDQGVADVVGLQPDKGKGPARLDAQAMNKLRRNAFSSEDNMNQYIAELERDWMSSAKIDKCMEVLEAISQRDTTEKTIIFSQWTSLLQLLEVPIHRKGWKYRRYDGSMDSRARNDAVIQFTDDPNIKIMLISLKAGNSGLNLVAASQVIILDPFYNPYVEEQAIDRAHRIGQVRPLTVHRLTVERTVEERVLTIQQEKKDLIEGALDETEAKGIGRLGERDLAFLFGIGQH